MSKKDVAQLRRRAEEFVAAQPAGLDNNQSREVKQLVHELTVHQVELEMQNEELHRTEHLLEQSRDRYRQLFEFMPVGYAVLDPDGVIVEVNPAFVELLGLQDLDPRGSKFTDFIVADGQDDFYLLRRNADRTGESCSCEIQITKTGQTPFYADVTINCGIKKQGQASCYHICLSDISARKLAESNLEASYLSAQKTIRDVIATISNIVETRDPFTSGHQKKVARLSKAMAKEMEMDDGAIETIGTAAELHDVGKIYVSADILSKPGILTDIEMQLVKIHVRGSFDILRRVNFNAPIAEIVLQHHERINGSGYPSGLKGEDILREAKILAVADVVEAMSAHRPYRPAFGIDRALEEISKNKGVLYDPDVVDACLNLFKEKGFDLAASD